MEQEKKKKKSVPEWKRHGFKSYAAYAEWSRELAEDVRHGYC